MASKNNSDVTIDTADTVGFSFRGLSNDIPFGCEEDSPELADDVLETSDVEQPGLQHFDFDGVQNSPEENWDIQASIHNDVKVTIGDEYTGGDWIFSPATGKGMTISFFFQGRNGWTYGLTSAHIVDRCHEPLEVFASNDRDPVTQEVPMKEIGRVLHISVETDSCIFSVNDGIRVSLNTIKISPHHKLEIDLSKVPKQLDIGTELRTFGAKRRGITGKLAGFADNNHQNVARLGDLVVPSDKKNVLITHYGDCGSVAIDRQGNPLAVSRAVLITPYYPFEYYIDYVISFIQRSPFYLRDRHSTAYLVPLQSILQAHQSYFGIHVELVPIPEDQLLEVPNIRGSKIQKAHQFFKPKPPPRGILYHPYKRVGPAKSDSWFMRCALVMAVRKKFH